MSEKLQLNLNSIGELNDQPFGDLGQFEFVRYDYDRFTTVLLSRIRDLEDRLTRMFGSPCVVFGDGTVDSLNNVTSGYYAEYYVVTANGVLAMYGESHTLFASGPHYGQ